MFPGMWISLQYVDDKLRFYRPISWLELLTCSPLSEYQNLNDGMTPIMILIHFDYVLKYMFIGVRL